MATTCTGPSLLLGKEGEEAGAAGGASTKAAGGKCICVLRIMYYVSVLYECVSSRGLLLFGLKRQFGCGPGCMTLSA